MPANGLQVTVGRKHGIAEHPLQKKLVEIGRQFAEILSPKHGQKTRSHFLGAAPPTMVTRGKAVPLGRKIAPAS